MVIEERGEIMGKTIAQKIIEAHLVSGEMKVGEEIGIRIDQTLTQDATGTMAYLEFESMGIPRVKTERSVAYVDHTTHFSQVSRMLTTIDISRAYVLSTVYTIRALVMESAIRFTTSASVFLVKPS